MGTTLALIGAYTLAGSLSRIPCKSHTSQDISSALSHYEHTLRPTVLSAQKLAPGMPWLIHPQTAWGVWFMRTLIWVLFGVFQLGMMAARLRGPPANEGEGEREVKVEEYGFRRVGVDGVVSA